MKAHLLTSMIAIMAIGGLTGCSSNNAPLNSPETEKDARIIVEVDKPLAGLSEEQVKASQSNLMKKIAHNVTSNFTQVNSYTVLNNAFTLEVNKNDIEGIRNLSGVKSVTVDKMHAHKSIGSGATYSAKISRAAPDPSKFDPNRSAETMHKPTDATYEGEGTIVAILDNEFFFRGEHEETEDCSFHKLDLDGAGHGCDGSSVHHEVFSPLADDVPVKYTFDNIKTLSRGMIASQKPGVAAGKEGSLYYNNKVPFYYDYGGESKSYGKAGKMDYDVSSIVTYHGSHVASITAANAPYVSADHKGYEGIAPKAQLACMKVFTNFIADDTAKSLGFSDSSGAYDSCILAAIEDCISLGVDGINMSLGSDLDDFDSDSITLRTLSKLASEEGILTAISAGNSGKTSYSFAGSYGNWTTDMVETGIMSSYANNKDVTTVASGQPNYIFYKSGLRIGGKNIAYEDQIVNREGYEKDYMTEFWLKDLGASAEFQYIPGFGQASDYSDFTPAQLSGKVFVVNRGSTSFADKYSIAVSKGAIGLIIINNDPTSNDFNFRCSFGDGFSPTMPCALVLFRDRQTFVDADHGTFDIFEKEEAINADAYTLSTFTTDGATYNYDLKPEITAPGDNIRGAVPPQTKEHKETPLSSYEYLSGTSMSAPNLAGAQSFLLSNGKAGEIYTAAKAAGRAVNGTELKAIKAYRSTVDMRLQSTADPMFETDVSPESGELNYASPRLQGAGMVDLTGAMNTKVYLEGMNTEGEGINKAKIVLRDNEDISKGDVKLSFLAHNEGTSAKTYSVKLTVMRPAVKNANLLATKDYNYRAEVSDIQYLPGISYYDQYSGRQLSSYGSASYKDVYKLSRDIEYYKSQKDFDAGTKTTLKQGLWYVSSQGVDQTSYIEYKELPGYDYQSTQDVVLAEVTGQKVIVPANATTQVDINTYSLSAEQKEKIAKYYPYGCAIEGYVELIDDGAEADLCIPYLGFYAGGEGKSYKDAPVFEPFDFERKEDTIYPSYLVNDIARSLVGKTNCDMGSSWVVGYSENPAEIDTSKVLSNDLSLDMLKGFHKIGTDPLTGEYGESPSNELYVGNPYKTNTMLIQQYIMRSVNDNYFTITRKSDGRVVYKSVLEDMLYGDQYGRYPLYKSHVDAGYLSAGYIGHRAYAAIPLFDPKTNVAFEDGEYEITFNYQLVGCNNEWVSSSYTMHIDSTAPEFTSLSQYVDEETGKDMIRFNFRDAALSYGVVGYQLEEIKYDEKMDRYHIDMEKEQVLDIIEEIGVSSSGYHRLYLQVTDKAYGVNGVIIHFSSIKDLSKYEAVSHRNLLVNYDYKYDENGNIVFFSIDINGVETVVELEGEAVRIDDANNPDRPKANLALILGISIPAGVILLAGIGVGVFFLIKYKKKQKSLTKEESAK